MISEVTFFRCSFFTQMIMKCKYWPKIVAHSADGQLILLRKCFVSIFILFCFSPGAFFFINFFATLI